MIQNHTATCIVLRFSLLLPYSYVKFDRNIPIQELWARTSDSLNERLPIKKAREKFQTKQYFFYKKDSRFYPQIIRKSVFLIGQVPVKKMVENSVFTI